MPVSVTPLFLIRHSRPAFWLGALAFFLIGAWSAEVTGWYFWIGILFCTVPAGLIINGTNDIADKDSDAENPRKQAAGAVLSVQQARLLQSVILATALVFFVVFLRNSVASAITYLILISVWIAYSLPPIRLKRIPFIDSLSNGIGMLCFTFLARSLVLSGREIFTVSPVIWATLLGVIAVHALQATWDIESDAAHGDTTVGTLLHTRGAVVFAGVLFGTALMLLWSTVVLIQLYLIGLVTACGVLFFFPQKKYIYVTTWIILYSFPAVVLALYLLYPIFSILISS